MINESNERFLGEKKGEELIKKIVCEVSGWPIILSYDSTNGFDIKNLFILLFNVNNIC